MISTERAIPPERQAGVTVSPEYAELRAFFDGFAANEQRWRRRNRTYHRLLEQIFRFQIPSGVEVVNG